MRTPSDDLFRLIKSLTPNEKRYFKIWSSKHVVGKSNNYEKLFDAIDMLSDEAPYDEIAFKKTLRGKSYGKNLRDEKTNLKEILLKSMRVFHAEKTAEGRLSEMLQEIRFLYSKGLMDSCRSLIDKAYQQAVEYGQMETKLQLIRFMQLTDVSAYDESRRAESKKWQEETDSIMEMIEAERTVYYLREKLYFFYYGKNMESHKEEVDEIFRIFTEMERSENIPLQSLSQICNAKAVILESRNQNTAAADLYKALIQKWDENENMKAEYVARYENLIRNCLIQIWRSERFDEMPPLLEKLKAIQTSDPRFRSHLMLQYWHLSVIYYLNTEKYQEAYQLLPELEKEFKEEDIKLSFQGRINLMRNISILYLKNKDYTNLLKTINRIYETIGKREEYSYILHDVKFLEFIAQYETGGIHILDNLIRNAQRFFKEKKLNSEYSDWLWKQMKLLAMTEYSKISDVRGQIKRQIADTDCPGKYSMLKDLVASWL